MSVQQADQTPPVYPVSETNPPSHRQSDGSFGAVFVVLGVIVAVSVVACLLGRLCSKRYNKSKPSKHHRHTKEKDMKPNHNTFQTKDGDIEYGFDKRFSSAKVAANDEPNMDRPNSFHEPNMARPNSFHEPSVGRPNSFHEPNMAPNMGPNMGRPNSFHEQNMGPNMGRPNSYHDPNMGPNMCRPNSYHEPNMGPNMCRPNSFRETNMGPSLDRPNSSRDSPMGRPDSFQEPSMGRPNSFRKGEFRGDQMRYGGNEDHEMKFNSSTGPQYY